MSLTHYLLSIAFIVVLMSFDAPAGGVVMGDETGRMTPIVDSAMTFAASVAGTAAPPEIIGELCLLDVRYYSFDGLLHQGQLVVHRRIVEDVQAIFSLAEKIRFPIAKVVPVVHYGWSDETSMADNNSSAFNYRTVAGGNRMSHHARGLAVDINPFQNPVVYASGRTAPQGATYWPGERGVLTVDNPLVREFIKRGWRWGGNFRSFKDYHHFEKR